eukprot:m.232638 g.232638  ORF g.232638 m.232638 type:complete len:384 (+) comp18886_c5_seq1:475-1626(+)
MPSSRTMSEAGEDGNGLLPSPPSLSLPATLCSVVSSVGKRSWIASPCTSRAENDNNEEGVVEEMVVGMAGMMGAVVVVAVAVAVLAAVAVLGVVKEGLVALPGLVAVLAMACSSSSRAAATAACSSKGSTTTWPRASLRTVAATNKVLLLLVLVTNRALQLAVTSSPVPTNRPLAVTSKAPQPVPLHTAATLRNNCSSTMRSMLSSSSRARQAAPVGRLVVMALWSLPPLCVRVCACVALCVSRRWFYRRCLFRLGLPFSFAPFRLLLALLLLVLHTLFNDLSTHTHTKEKKSNRTKKINNRDRKTKQQGLGGDSRETHDRNDKPLPRTRIFLKRTPPEHQFIALPPPLLAFCCFLVEAEGFEDGCCVNEVFEDKAFGVVDLC